MAAMLLWVDVAQAQDIPSSETTYDFDDDLVTGDLVRPDGEQLIVLDRASQGASSVPHSDSRAFYSRDAEICGRFVMGDPGE